MDNLNLSIVIPGLTYGGIRCQEFLNSLQRLKTNNKVDLKIYSCCWDSDYNNIGDLVNACKSLNIQYVIKKEKYEDYFDPMLLDVIAKDNIFNIFLKHYINHGMELRFIDTVRKLFGFWYCLYNTLKLI